MALGKQAKIVGEKQVRAVLAELPTRRYPARDRAMFLFSLKAGLRAKEIGSITWSMVMDAEGEIADTIALENRAAKGKSGRVIPMHADLKAALMALQRERGDRVRSDLPIIHSVDRLLELVNQVCQEFGGTNRYNPGDSYCLTFSDPDRAMAATERLAQEWALYDRRERLGCSLLAALHKGTLYLYRSYLYSADLRTVSAVVSAARRLAGADTSIFVTGQASEARRRRPATASIPSFPRRKTLISARWFRSPGPISPSR